MAPKALVKAKQHPVIATLLTIGALAAAFVSLAQFTDIVDNAVISHEELTQILAAHSETAHEGTQAQIDLIRKESQCSSIDIQMAILSDVIWRLEQSEPSGIRLVEKKASMEKLIERRKTLGCASLA